LKDEDFRGRTLTDLPFGGVEVRIISV